MKIKVFRHNCLSFDVIMKKPGCWLFQETMKMEKGMENGQAKIVENEDVCLGTHPKEDIPIFIGRGVAIIFFILFWYTICFLECRSPFKKIYNIHFLTQYFTISVDYFYEIYEFCVILHRETVFVFSFDAYLDV